MGNTVLGFGKSSHHFILIPDPQVIEKKQLIAEMFADLHPDLDHLWKET